MTPKNRCLFDIQVLRVSHLISHWTQRFLHANQQCKPEPLQVGVLINELKILSDSFMSHIILVTLMYVPSSIAIRSLLVMETYIAEVLFKRYKNAKENLRLFNFRFNSLL